MSNKSKRMREYVRRFGGKGFYEILVYIRDHDRVILSDFLHIAGHGTVMDRREELLDLGLISDKKIKEGRRNYIVYEMTPKGETFLEKLERLLDIMEKE